MVPVCGFYMKIEELIKLFKGKFVQNISILLTGNIAAQAIALLAAPVITRLYQPDDFGIMTFIQSAAGIFTVIACMRYRYAIVLPKEKEEGYNLFALSIFSSFAVSIILVFLVFLFKGIVAEKCGFAGHENYLFFLPFIVFIASSSDIFVYLYTRFKDFKIISFVTVLMPIANSATKIGAGFLLSASAFWLIFGNLIGPLLASFLFLVFMKGKLSEIIKNINVARLRQSAYKYREFPKYNMPTGFINSISQNLPVLLFSYFFSQEIVGFYGLANMVLKRPVAIMSQSISKVFLQKSSEIQNQGGDLYKNLRKTTLGLAVIGIIPFAILTIAGKWIFGFVFGKEWLEAGLYAQALAPWLFLLLINQPATQTYLVKQKLRFLLYFNCINVFIKFISITAGFYIFHDAFYSVLLFSASGVFMNIFFILNALVIVKKEKKYVK